MNSQSKSKSENIYGNESNEIINVKRPLINEIYENYNENIQNRIIIDVHKIKEDENKISLQIDKTMYDNDTDQKQNYDNIQTNQGLYENESNNNDLSKNQNTLNEK